MQSPLARILDFPATGQHVSDAQNLLSRFGAFDTAVHQQRVAYEAVRLAVANGVGKGQAALAAWLHDLSGVIPHNARVAACAELHIELLPVEVEHPVLSHAKLSRGLAELVLNVTDRAVLEAVQCHTTLRPKATTLDKVLFLADKIESDAPQAAASYGHSVRVGLEQSLDAGCLAYLQFVVDNAQRLGWPIHPDLEAAHAELSAAVAAAGPAPAKPRQPSAPRKRRSTARKAAKPAKFVIKGPLIQRPREGGSA